MIVSIPFILILGTLLGFLSGIGIGGGSLLILWLTIVLEVPHPIARGINLLFFLPSALVSCFFRWRHGSLNLSMLLPAIATGCICAALFSWISTMLDTALLHKLFGGMLIITGVREILYKPKRKGA